MGKEHLEYTYLFHSPHVKSLSVTTDRITVPKLINGVLNTISTLAKSKPLILPLS